MQFLKKTSFRWGKFKVGFAVLSLSLGYMTTLSSPVHAVERLNLLVIMDDSGSMAQEQEKFASEFLGLLSRLNNYNWTVSVISSSSPCPLIDPLSRYEFNHDPHGSYLSLYEGLQPGPLGSAFEKPLASLIGHLTANFPSSDLKCEFNATYYWRHTPLAVLFVADEDISDDVSLEYVAGFMAGMGYIPGKNVKMFGFVPDHNNMDYCAAGLGAGPEALHFEELFTTFGGESYSICTSSYSYHFQKMADKIGEMFQ